MQGLVQGKFHQAPQLFSTDLELGRWEIQALSFFKLLTAKIILLIGIAAEAISFGIPAISQILSTQGPLPYAGANPII